MSGILLPFTRARIAKGEIYHILNILAVSLLLTDKILRHILQSASIILGPTQDLQNHVSPARRERHHTRMFCVPPHALVPSCLQRIECQEEERTSYIEVTSPITGQIGKHNMVLKILKFENILSRLNLQEAVFQKP